VTIYENGQGLLLNGKDKKCAFDTFTAKLNNFTMT